MKKEIKEQIKLLEKDLNSVMKMHEMTSANMDKLIIYVLKCHNTIEVGLEMIIINHIFKPNSLSWVGEEQKGPVSRIAAVFMEMDFGKKVKVIFKHYKLGNQKEFKNLFKLNDIRIEFAHPAAYWSKFEKYDNPVEYLRVLKILAGALSEMKDIVPTTLAWLSISDKG